ncbi:unknown protein [Seminavis robusta]|uniref:Uncharacterized protein n=1 Tax=Seminavis robusta TaxID=568900 RepID=A0A9N8H0Z4_9STRA|nr:unknown protein [Seminavis robusta]|eukprot:Sro30_g019651.1  (383) ;mRNA; r:86828-87976
MAIHCIQNVRKIAVTVFIALMLAVNTDAFTHGVVPVGGKPFSRPRHGLRFCCTSKDSSRQTRAALHVHQSSFGDKNAFIDGVREVNDNFLNHLHVVTLPTLWVSLIASMVVMVLRVRPSNLYWLHKGFQAIFAAAGMISLPVATVVSICGILSMMPCVGLALWITSLVSSIDMDNLFLILAAASQKLSLRVQRHAEKTAFFTMADWALSTPLTWFACSVLLFPLHHQILFGQIHSGIVKRLFGRKSKLKDSALKSADYTSASKHAKMTRSGFLVWAFSSSFVLGSFALAKWTPPIEHLVSIRCYDRAAFLSLLAICHGALEFFVSLKVFAPMFQRHGVFAAIGAQMAWNFNFILLPITAPFRMTKRLFRDRETQTESETPKC